MDFINEWRKASYQWNSNSPPCMLKADEVFLKCYPRVTYRSWDEAIGSPDFYHPSKSKDKRIHLGLLPCPFMGGLINASIYVLMTNPGVTVGDYREHERSELRSVLLANLRQERLDGVLPFIFLDRQFACHDGFGYWNKKVGLGKTIQDLAKRKRMSESESRTVVWNKLAVIQSVPYHSANGPNAGNKLGSWPSVHLAGQFVRDTVVKRVRTKQAIVVVVRQVKRWNQYIPEDLDDEQGVVRYANAGEARSASLRPASGGGSAILRHLDATA